MKDRITPCCGSSIARSHATKFSLLEPINGQKHYKLLVNSKMDSESRGLGDKYRRIPCHE